MIQNSNLLRSENYEQGTSRDRSRRVEAYRRIEEGVQQGTVDSPAMSRGTRIMSGITSRISSREMATSSGARTADRLGHSVPSSADTEVRLLAPSRRRRPAPLAGRREGGESGPPDLAFGRGQLLTHNPGWVGVGGMGSSSGRYLPPAAHPLSTALCGSGLVYACVY